MSDEKEAELELQSSSNLNGNEKPLSLLFEVRVNKNKGNEPPAGPRRRPWSGRRDEVVWGGERSATMPIN